jgi:hypothetical protein
MKGDAEGNYLLLNICIDSDEDWHKTYSNDDLPSNSNHLSWGTTKFTLLGIIFYVDLHKIPKRNYDQSGSRVMYKSVLVQHSWKKKKVNMP